MTNFGTIDHHKPIKYVEAEMPLETSFTIAVAADGKRVIISGACPACGGHTSADFPYGIGGSGSKGWGFRGPSGPPPTVRSPVTVYCECGHAHAARPPNAPDIGCGRFWPVELTLA